MPCRDGQAAARAFTVATRCLPPAATHTSTPVPGHLGCRAVVSSSHFSLETGASSSNFLPEISEFRLAKRRNSASVVCAASYVKLEGFSLEGISPKTLGWVLVNVHNYARFYLVLDVMNVLN